MDNARAGGCLQAEWPGRGRRFPHMALDRQVGITRRLRSTAAAAALVGGVAACSSAAVSLILPPGPTERLQAAGGEQAMPVLIVLMAGTILWAFGAAALAVARARWSPYVAAATIGAGAVGITAGAPLLFDEFGMRVIAGAIALLGGVILVGGGVLARGIATSVPLSRGS